MKLFTIMFIQYFLVVANTRAYAQGHYAWTAVTDLVFAWLNFTLIQQVAKSNSTKDRVAYTLGGTTGALVAIWVTKIVYGA